MLHTVNKSPFEKNSLRSCLSHAKQGSGILLIEDAVYGAVRGTSVENDVQAATQGGYKVYVLGPDLKARGMDAGNLIDGVTVVDYAGFVDLAAEYDKVQAWL